MLTLEYLKQIIGSARKVEELSHYSKDNVMQSSDIYCNTGDGLLIEVDTDGYFNVFTSTDKETWSLVEQVTVKCRTIRQYDYAVPGSYWKVESEDVIRHLSFRAIRPFLVSPYEITDLDSQVIESDAGYDGIVELLNVRPDANLAIVVLENSEGFSFEVNPGGVQHLSQTVWCMAVVGADEDRKKVQLSMYNLMRRIIAKMILERRAGRLGGWDWSHIPVLVTNAGSNYTGYQFTLYFNEVTDLSMKQFGELWQ